MTTGTFPVDKEAFLARKTEESIEQNNSTWFAQDRIAKAKSDLNAASKLIADKRHDVAGAVMRLAVERVQEAIRAMEKI